MKEENKLSLSPAGFDITPPHISPKKLDITPPHQAEPVSPKIEEKSIDIKQKSPNKSLQELEDVTAKNNVNEGLIKIKEGETAKSNDKEEKIEEESNSDDQKEKSKPIGEFLLL
jgi:hypothetical protein